MISDLNLPPRDRKYSLGILAFAGLLLTATLIFPVPSHLWITTGVVLVVGLLLFNLIVWKRPIFPYDRILSAVSADGLCWTRELGIRMDVGGMHRSTQVYNPQVVEANDRYRMYYRAGQSRALIARADSSDGISWQEVPEVQVGTGGQFDLTRVETSNVVRVGPCQWRMYYAGVSSGLWRIYCQESSDGTSWQRERLCVDMSQQTRLDNAMNPCVVADNSGYRIYYDCFSSEEIQIYTAHSKDGLQWEEFRPCSGEYRDEKAFVGGFPCVVRTEKNLLRMYFVEYPKASIIGSCLVSAISEDGLSWQREPGIRLAPGGRYDRYGVFCGSVVRLKQGWRMYYGGYWEGHLLEPWTLFRHRRKRGWRKTRV